MSAQAGGAGGAAACHRLSRPQAATGGHGRTQAATPCRIASRVGDAGPARPGKQVNRARPGGCRAVGRLGGAPRVGARNDHPHPRHAAHRCDPPPHAQIPLPPFTSRHPQFAGRRAVVLGGEGRGCVRLRPTAPGGGRWGAGAGGRNRRPPPVASPSRTPRALPPTPVPASGRYGPRPLWPAAHPARGPRPIRPEAHPLVEGRSGTARRVRVRCGAAGARVTRRSC
jgi:hypothetical protein